MASRRNKIKGSLGFQNICLFKLPRVPEQQFVNLGTIILEPISWLSEKSDEEFQPILWYSILYCILKTKIQIQCTHVQPIQKPNCLLAMQHHARRIFLEMSDGSGIKHVLLIIFINYLANRIRLHLVAVRLFQEMGN